jgi:hypothetical protein
VVDRVAQGLDWKLNIWVPEVDPLAIDGADRNSEPLRVGKLKFRNSIWNLTLVVLFANVIDVLNLNFELFEVLDNQVFDQNVLNISDVRADQVGKLRLIEEIVV